MVIPAYLFKILQFFYDMDEIMPVFVPFAKFRELCEEMCKNIEEKWGRIQMWKW